MLTPQVRSPKPDHTTKTSAAETRAICGTASSALSSYVLQREGNLHGVVRNVTFVVGGMGGLGELTQKGALIRLGRGEFRRDPPAAPSWLSLSAGGTGKNRAAAILGGRQQRLYAQGPPTKYLFFHSPHMHRTALNISFAGTKWRDGKFSREAECEVIAGSFAFSENEEVVLTSEW